MAALDVGKGASMDDDDGMVATWWRPAEPCTCWSFAAACSAGGSGGMARLEAAWGILELRVERRSKVAPWDLLRAGACAWWLSCCSATRVPGCSPGASIPGVLFHSGGLVGPPWVPKDVHSPSGLGDRTPYAPRRRRRGGPTSGGVPFSIIKSFFLAVFWGIPSSIGVAPTWEPSKPCVIG
jgi:hypothetical protein